MHIRTIGIDLGKTIFHLVAQDEHGNVVVRKRSSPTQLLNYTVNLPSCLIGMEACPGAHFLAAKLTAQGHQVRLIPAQFVRPFVKSNKNDYLDAEAIAEAVQRPTMRFVPIKTMEQLDLQAVHRLRDQLIARRTGLINQIRAFLLERGITVRQGRKHLRGQMAFLLEDAIINLSPRMRNLLNRQWREWQELDIQIEELSVEINNTADQDEVCGRLLKIPGIGALTATALVAAIGDGSAFRRGRDFSAWLGLVPRQATTGNRPLLLGISKRGNSYLRRLFIHGARSIATHMNRQNQRFGPWISRLESKVHRNVLVVAIANKLARIAWAVLAKGEAYRPALELKPI
jgi:transposase